METLTKISSTEEENETSTQNKDKKDTKPKFSTKRDPSVRMSYIVPEEISSEDLDS
ncbi:MAG TPA: hypothetical protein PK079_20740 [Leptospiraceae bacterium]|nr:hypothetical protein [Leptospiraceae bacterium]HMW04137.1 hypothetical protein [Leptospiraceae bacterium]HMX30796.1 hypothetical protein [Leptospiraceae bacterium]HMY30130.1 hypothetical protein [Leptospiraceae bacterium]HMZ64363.1 hypothetical protein [Leptospiraceae bacterium]